MNADSVEPCYHCGEPLVERASDYADVVYAELGDTRRPMCCLGCKAVAEFIFNSGLESFYQHRDAPQSELGLSVGQSDWRIYDDEDLLRRYVHDADSVSESTIDIGGMYCAACTWLLESVLSQYPAIESVAVNPVTHRAVVHWDCKTLKYSELLEAIARVGFKPTPTSFGRTEGKSDGEDKDSLRRLIVAAAAGMQVMMFSAGLYAGEHYGIEGRIEEFLQLISLLVCLPIVFYSARPFFSAAYRGIRARTAGMDLPISIAIAAAFIASLHALVVKSGDIYFDSIAMFVLFLSVARYLEMRARHRSDDHADALAQLLPDVATRISNDVPEVVSIDSLRAGDTVLVRPGDVIPTDGVVASGELAVDESLLTGETQAVMRGPGMNAVAGGINRSGTATIKVTQTGASTSLAEIGRLLECAKADRPPVALLADRVAGYFVSGMLLIATLTGLLWMAVDSSRAFETVLAVLVVSCPCALSLATPAAIASATSRLAREGFLLARSRILEVLAQETIFVFDKTGTLTAGRPEVLQTKLFSQQEGYDEADYLGLAAAIETASEHVLARAFVNYLKPGKLQVETVSITQGAGVAAIVSGVKYHIGSSAYVAENIGAYVPEVAGGSCSYVYLSNDERVLARFAIGDELRADAADAVDDLQSLGHSIVILSGDRVSAVAMIAQQLGVKQWHAQQTPANKVEFVRMLQRDGARVVMVGDGINDAPVLSVADASIAIDAGTALARASADAIAMGKRLRGVANAARIAVQTKRVIQQNIVWAIVYNLTAIPLAAMGFLAPWMAAIGMSISSLLVVLNSLRLQRIQIDSMPKTRSVQRQLSHDEALT